MVKINEVKAADKYNNRQLVYARDSRIATPDFGAEVWNKVRKFGVEQAQATVIQQQTEKAQAEQFATDGENLKQETSFLGVDNTATKAYNKAANVIYENQKATQLNEFINTASVQYQNDPVAFTAARDEFYKSWTEGMPKRMQPAYKMKAQQEIDPIIGKIAVRRGELERQEAAVGTRLRMGNILDRITNILRDPEKADSVESAEAIAEYLELLEQAEQGNPYGVGHEAPMFDTKEVAIAQDALDQTVNRAFVRLQYDQSNNKQAWLEAFEKGEYDKGTGELAPRTHDTLLREIRTERREAEREATGYKRSTTERFRPQIQAVEQGLTSEAENAALLERARESGVEEVVEATEAAVAGSNAVREFKSMSPTEMDGEIERLRNIDLEERTSVENNLIKQFERYREQLGAALARDPLGATAEYYADPNANRDPLKPLNFDGDLEAQFAERAATVAEYEAVYGIDENGDPVRDLPLFTKDELKGLVDEIKDIDGTDPSLRTRRIDALAHMLEYKPENARQFNSQVRSLLRKRDDAELVVAQVESSYEARIADKHFRNNDASLAAGYINSTIEQGRAIARNNGNSVYDRYAKKDVEAAIDQAIQLRLPNGNADDPTGEFRSQHQEVLRNLMFALYPDTFSENGKKAREETEGGDTRTIKLRELAKRALAFYYTGDEQADITNANGTAIEIPVYPGGPTMQEVRQATTPDTFLSMGAGGAYYETSSGQQRSFIFDDLRKKSRLEPIAGQPGRYAVYYTRAASDGGWFGSDIDAHASLVLNADGEPLILDFTKTIRGMTNGN